MTATALEPLEEAIIRHLPTSTSRFFSRDGATQRVHDYANEFVFAAHFPRLYLGKYPRKKIEDVERSLFELVWKIINLPDNPLLIPEFEPSLNKEFPSGVSASAAIETLREFIASLKKDATDDYNENTNWVAAAVALVCKLTWQHEAKMVALENGLEPHFIKEALRDGMGLDKIHDDFTGEALMDDDEAERFDPKLDSKVDGLFSTAIAESKPPDFEKTDAPGPFGRFFEDVFTCLSVSDDEQDLPSTSAASALRTLRRLGIQVGHE